MSTSATVAATDAFSNRTDPVMRQIFLHLLSALSTSIATARREPWWFFVLDILAYPFVRHTCPVQSATPHVICASRFNQSAAVVELKTIPSPVCVSAITGRTVLLAELAPYPRGHVVGVGHKQKIERVLAYFPSRDCVGIVLYTVGCHRN